MHIVGTAGHVDHGKSSLVMALTGTNPDRWLEERERGMTLDLGFAHLRFDDGAEAGIIDVPGHERFLHNMLAGAAGMEVLLLVVAADEGVMPQTIEHLQILRYLNVRRTIVVVTKADLLSTDELAFACEAIVESLQGSVAQDAPVVAVSSTTGAGLADLRSLLHEALNRLEPREPHAPAYLPIDRVFALPGHGTIVTGTLMQGQIAVGDGLKLEPSGKAVRVRSLQTFGRKCERVEGGSRVALNLPGIEVGQIARGEMLVAVQFAATDTFAVRFQPLKEAAAALRRRTPVRAYIGSAEILGTLRLDESPNGSNAIDGRLFLRSATVAYPGTAFIVRHLSPKKLLGGGRIQNAESRGAKCEAATEDELLETAILGALRSSTLRVASPAELAREANLREDSVQQVLENLANRDMVLRVLRPNGYIDAERSAAFLETVLAFLRTQQAAEPWSMGVTSLALSRALAVPETLLIRVLAAHAELGRIALRAGYYATPEHAPHLSAEQQAFFDEIMPIDVQQPLVPFSLALIAARVKQSRVKGIGKAFDMLLAKGALVKVQDDLYRGTQIAKIHSALETFLLEKPQITMAQFRDLIGTSRKYAVPLLEWFDGREITIRSGDYRALRKRRAHAVSRNQEGHPVV